MANVQVSITQAWSCFCDTNSSAGLIPGPETAEYNDSIYIYAEAATPADAIQGVIDAGRVPDAESFDRMVQQVIDFYGTNSESQEAQDALAAIEQVRQDPTPKG